MLSPVRRCVALTRPTLLHAPRTLFTLPDLSSLSPFHDPSGKPEEPQTYHERKILPYRASQLYNVVADIGSYPRFVPFCTAARILDKAPLPATRSSGPAVPSTMEAELTVGFLSFKESYISKVTCLPNECVEAIASSSTPLFKTLTTAWRFQPASNHSPHLSRSLPLSNASYGSQTRSHSSSTLAPASRETDSSPTLVTLDLSFAFANPVHAAVSAAFFGQVSKMMVQAFEERCLEVYGPGEK